MLTDGALAFFLAGFALAAVLLIGREHRQKRALQRRFEEQRNRLRTIIDSEPECVKLQQRDGTITEINPAGLSLLGTQQAGDVVGHQIYEFLVEDYQAPYRQLTVDVFNGKRATMEFEVIGIRGERRWLETHATPLKDAQGQVSALLAITRDINERKRTEEQLRRQQAELAHICRLSTLSELASGLAHELNQPLCAISSYAQCANSYLQQSPPQNTELGSLLGKIDEQTQRASGIIQHLRDFVRKRAPKPQAIAPHIMIDNALRLSEAERHKHRIRLDLQIDTPLPRVRADRVQVEQVLVNLVGNAIQAMQDQNSERRTLSIGARHQSGDGVLFSVVDQGGGIDDDAREQLFVPFFSTKPSGLGMGLAISRTIIESHGGRIWYDSEPGRGTCFHFLLPDSPTAS